MLYTLLKFLHVVLAIIAVGFNASYAVWLTLARRQPEHAASILRGIKILDDRFANPAYALLPVLGVAMVLVGDLSFTTFWIAASLVLYVVMASLAIGVYTPTLRAQAELAERGDVTSDRYQHLATRNARLGSVLGALVLVIVYLMVAKPTL